MYIICILDIYFFLVTKTNSYHHDPGQDCATDAGFFCCLFFFLSFFFFPAAPAAYGNSRSGAGRIRAAAATYTTAAAVGAFPPLRLAGSPGSLGEQRLPGPLRLARVPRCGRASRDPCLGGAAAQLLPRLLLRGHGTGSSTTLWFMRNFEMFAENGNEEQSFSETF